VIKNITSVLAGVLGMSGVFGLYIGMGLGWFYWIYVGVKLGSFGMVIVAVLGPGGFIASFLGLWSFIFGPPLWLVHWVT
jgi:hypothetical protein